ncbi:MAG: DNA polymerase III subunit [Oscillospiraceae bacterium]|nr:DNA polymerase III subunit [Oscillospiraceae bacterium]
MGFESLLGNERLKENLQMSLQKDHASHFYLISGPAGSGKHTLARLLSAAVQCENTNRPCLRCNSCRKVMANTHPDCITVIDPDHKTVAVKLVRDARADIYVMPNEGRRKVYIFPQELGVEGQNALLKILEEPPQYGVFILLSDNPEKLLPTVRSRCTELSLQALPDSVLRSALQKDFPQADADSLAAAAARSGGYLGQAKQILESGSTFSQQAQDFTRAFCQRDSLGLVQVLVPMEKWKRDQAIPELQTWLSLLQEALIFRSGMQAASPLARQLAAARSSAELMAAISQLQKSIEYAQGNVSVAAICGHLQWSLR